MGDLLDINMSSTAQQCFLEYDMLVGCSEITINQTHSPIVSEDNDSIKSNLNDSHLNSHNTTSWYSSSNSDKSPRSCNSYYSINNKLVSCEMACAEYSISSGSKPLSLIIRRCSTPVNECTGCLSNKCINSEFSMDSTLDQTNSNEEDECSSISSEIQEQSSANEEVIDALCETGDKAIITPSDKCTKPEVCFISTFNQNNLNEEADTLISLKIKNQSCTNKQVVDVLHKTSDDATALHYIDSHTYKSDLIKSNSQLCNGGVSEEVSESMNLNEAILCDKTRLKDVKLLRIHHAGSFPYEHTEVVNTSTDISIVNNEVEIYSPAHILIEHTKNDLCITKPDLSTCDVQLSSNNNTQCLLTKTKNCQATDTAVLIENMVVSPNQNNMLDKNPETDNINSKNNTNINSSGLRFNTKQSQYICEQSSVNAQSESQLDLSEIKSKLSYQTNLTSALCKSTSNVSLGLQTSLDEAKNDNSLAISFDTSINIESKYKSTESSTVTKCEVELCNEDSKFNPPAAILRTDSCARSVEAVCNLTATEELLSAITSEVMQHGILIDSNVVDSNSAPPPLLDNCATNKRVTIEELFLPIIEPEVMRQGVLTDFDVNINLSAPHAVHSCATNTPIKTTEVFSPIIEFRGKSQKVLNNSHNALIYNLSALVAEDCSTNVKEVSSDVVTGHDLIPQGMLNESHSASYCKPLPVSMAANLQSTNIEGEYGITQQFASLKCKSDLIDKQSKTNTNNRRGKVVCSSPNHSMGMSSEADHEENSPLLFSSDDELETADQERDLPSLYNVLMSREQSRLAHLQELLLGVPPPPSVTIPQLSVPEMLKLLKDNQQLMNMALPTQDLQSCKSSLKPVGSLEEAMSFHWPEVKSCCYHDIHYNLGLVSEELESHSQRLQQRLVGSETATSCSLWAVTVPGTKRRSLSLSHGHSPGRRLSHLARRRNAFSIASVQLKPVQRRQVMVEVKKSERVLKSSQKKKKILNEQDVRRQISRTKINSSKRALFQSPPQDKKRKSPSSSTSKSKLRTNVERSRVGHSRRALWPDTLNDLDNKKFTNTNGSGKKRCREESHTETRKCPRRLFNDDPLCVKVGEGSQSSRLPLKTNSTFQNNTSERTTNLTLTSHHKSAGSNFKKGFSSTHKKKLLWAVAEALRCEGVGLNHPRFKACATALAGKCRHHLLDLLGPQTPIKRIGSTSDRMLQIASTFAVTIVHQIIS